MNSEILCTTIFHRRSFDSFLIVSSHAHAQCRNSYYMPSFFVCLFCFICLFCFVFYITEKFHSRRTGFIVEALNASKQINHQSFNLNSSIDSDFEEKVVNL